MPPAAEIAIPRAEAPGIRWAFGMLALQVGEVLVLLEVMLSDRRHSGLEHEFGAMEIYFAVVVLSAAVQAVGIALVWKARYRIGGALQIAASSLHLFKVEGLIGMIGGLRAWKHPRRAAGSPAAV